MLLLDQWLCDYVYAGHCLRLWMFVMGDLKIASRTYVIVIMIFQFHFGTIKRLGPLVFGLAVFEFQFHIGPIKSL